MKNERNKKFILVLSGGFGNGGFQAGALKYIEEHGLKIEGKSHQPKEFDAIFSISVGGYNGIMTAMGKQKELIELWKEIAGNPNLVYESEYLSAERSEIKIDYESLIKHLTSDLNFIQKIRMVGKRGRKKALNNIAQKLSELKGLASFTPLSDRIKTLVSLKEIKSTSFNLGLVSLTDGQYYRLSHKDFENDQDFRKAILGMGSIPVAFPPVPEIKTKQYSILNSVDGALRNRTPLGDAVNHINSQDDDCEYHFVIISCHTGKQKVMTEQPNVLSAAFRSLYDITLNEILLNDTNAFLKINSLVKQAKQKGVHLVSKSGKIYKDFKVKVVRPIRELGASHDFSKEKILDTISQGYQIAKSVDLSSNWK